MDVCGREVVAGWSLNGRMWSSSVLRQLSRSRYRTMDDSVGWWLAGRSSVTVAL